MIHVARTWIKVFCPKMIFAVPGFAFQMHSTHLNYAHHKEKQMEFLLDSELLYCVFDDTDAFL